MELEGDEKDKGNSHFRPIKTSHKQNVIVQTCNLQLPIAT